MVLEKPQVIRWIQAHTNRRVISPSEPLTYISKSVTLGPIDGRVDLIRKSRLWF